MFIKNMLNKPSQSLQLGIALLLGLMTGYLQLDPVTAAAEMVSDVFLSLLKLVSLPIIFFSILSTVTGMNSLDTMRSIGKMVVKYTLITTLIAASVALSIFLWIQPVATTASTSEATISVENVSTMHYLIKAIPSNVIQPFAEHNVIGVLFLGIFFSLAVFALPTQQRESLHKIFEAIFAAVMKMTRWVVTLLPIAIWAFITLSFRDFQQGLNWMPLVGYLCCVLLANAIQGCVVLPALLLSKGISPVKLFKAVSPALSVAFFSKSSSAALSIAVEAAENRAKLRAGVVRFSLPLCTSINMNACAAFILTTVLFVSMSYGVTYTPIELIGWIFVATIAAIGNASVPMGCFTLAGAFLASMDVPLEMMGVILPFYSLIDMFESALNVWSDCCVTAVVDKETAPTRDLVGLPSNG